MKMKRARILSLVLCLVMLVGILPVGAAAASYYDDDIFFDDYLISDGEELEIDLDDYYVYNESGKKVADIYDSISGSKLYVSDLEDHFECYDNRDYYCVIEFYTTSSRSKRISGSSIDLDDYSVLYATVYAYNYDTESSTYEVDISFLTDGSSSSDDAFYMAAKSGSDNYFDASLFESSIGSYDLDDVYFVVEKLPSGSLYEGSSTLKVGDEISLDDIDDISYYKSSGSSTDSMTFSLIYYRSSSSSGTYLVKNATLYFVFNYDTAESFTVNFTAGQSVALTQKNFTDNFTAASSSGSLKSIKILSLPTSGTLYLNNKAVSKNDVITYSQLANLSYTPSNSTVTSDGFVYAATSGTLYSESASVVLSAAYSPSSYTVTTSGSIVTVTYATATSSATQLTQTLSADDVTYLVSQANNNGSTLVVDMPLSSGSTYTGRSLTIDSSMFSNSNLSVFSRIILMDTSSSGNTIYLTVPTSSVATLYSTYSGSFTMSLSAANLTDEDKSAAASSVGLARDVDMTIGSNTVSPSGAELSIPYYASNDHYTSVIMVRTGYQSYEPVLSSTWSDTMPYLTTDTNPYVTCQVEGNKIYLSTINNSTFSDMASTHWGYDFIRFLTARGVMSGYGGVDEGKVKPDASVTRAEFVKMLVAALDLYNASATTTYTDVTGNAAWAASYIGSAQAAGIVTDSGSSFRPTEAITREEMALYAYRAASAAGITLPQTTAAITFNDANEFSSTEITTAITAMQRAGIISGEAVNGVATGDFDPQGVTTRAAAAKIISMLMELAY